MPKKISALPTIIQKIKNYCQQSIGFKFFIIFSIFLFCSWFIPFILKLPMISSISHSFLKSLGYSHPIDYGLFFSSIAQSLAALLAIAFSILILFIQIMYEKFSGLSIQRFLQKNIVIITLSLYSFTIIFSLYQMSHSHINPVEEMIWAFFLTLISLIFLALLTFNVFKIISHENVILNEKLYLDLIIKKFLSEQLRLKFELSNLIEVVTRTVNIKFDNYFGHDYRSNNNIYPKKEGNIIHYNISVIKAYSRNFIHSIIKFSLLIPVNNFVFNNTPIAFYDKQERINIETYNPKFSDYILISRTIRRRNFISVYSDIS